MYDRTINGEIYDFGVSGKLIMNVLVMYDRQTESYWSQLLGEAIEGELKGTQLDFFPSWQTTWGEWVQRYPNTLALDKGNASTIDSYASYYQSNATGIIDETIEDDRLRSKEFVIGVASEGEATAYPFPLLAQERVVNDTVGGIPIAVAFITDGATGLVYDRRVNGETLDFEVRGEFLVDTQTESRWDMWQGVAVSGDMDGQILRRMEATRSFWFGWKDWYPETQVYGEDAN